MVCLFQFRVVKGSKGLGGDQRLDSCIERDAGTDCLSTKPSRSFHVNPGQDVFKQDIYIFPAYPLAKFIHLPGISRSPLDK